MDISFFIAGLFGGLLRGGMGFLNILLLIKA